MGLTAENLESLDTLAENLLLLRTWRRLTQAQLAGKAGPPFSQETISQIERGLRPSNPERDVPRLAKALGVPVNLLVGPRLINPGAVDRATSGSAA